MAVRAIGDAQDRRGHGAPAEDCVRPLLAGPEALIDKAVEMVGAAVLGAVFAGGWTPVDLVELARRRSDAAGIAYVLDATALATAEHPRGLVDRRWQAQLDGYDARVWWDRRRPHLSQLAARDRQTREQALAAAIDVHALLESVPRLEQVLPPPGTPDQSAGTRAVDPAQEKMMAKIRALLAKAESTEFDDEAEALSAKAQELISHYSLDRALIEHVRGAQQQTTLCRIWLDSPYVNAKSMLVGAVARANRCQTILFAEWGFTTVLGDPVDLGGVELLTTSLLVQATRAMVSTGSQVSRSGTSRTRSFRQSFLVAYAGRIGERLRAADEGSQSSIGDGRLLPVLAARSRAVEDEVRQRFPHLVSKRVSVSNAAGWGAGRAAADLASINVRDALAGAGGPGARERTA